MNTTETSTTSTTSTDNGKIKTKDVLSPQITPEMAFIAEGRQSYADGQTEALRCVEEDLYKLGRKDMRGAVLRKVGISDSGKARKAQVDRALASYLQAK